MIACQVSRPGQAKPPALLRGRLAIGLQLANLPDSYQALIQ
jgi:hypothetical protein